VGRQDRLMSPALPTRTPVVVPAVPGTVPAGLAVASALHVSGLVTGRSASYDSGHAGIAEAVIAVVLAAGAPRTAGGPGAAGFATAGFPIGPSLTARGGHRPDTAYHLVVLPAPVGILVARVRRR
jgi:hypothetical protein